MILNIDLADVYFQEILGELVHLLISTESVGSGLNAEEEMPVERHRRKNNAPKKPGVITSTRPAHRCPHCVVLAIPIGSCLNSLSQSSKAFVEESARGQAVGSDFGIIGKPVENAVIRDCDGLKASKPGGDAMKFGLLLWPVENAVIRARG